MIRIFSNIFRFYYEGFRGMTTGRKLWMVIFIKLFIIFIILRLFFFQDFLGAKFNNEGQKSEYVLDNLTHHN
jgi:hypothetical protein